MSILRLSFVVALSLCALAPLNPLRAADEVVQPIEVKPGGLPALPADSPAEFVTVLGSTALAVVPAGDGFALWTAPAGAADAKWSPVEKVTPRRWSGYAAAGDALYAVGGLEAGQPSARVQQFTLDAGGAVVGKDLPNLPVPVVAAGVGVLDKALYVFGGATSLQPPALEKTLWKLDLTTPGAAWENLGPYPGAARAFAAVATQQGVFGVFGGLVAAADGTLAPSAEMWTFRAKPGEATTFSGWRQGANLPQPQVGAQALPLGQSGIFLVGALETLPVPTAAPAVPPASPLLYNVVTDAWATFPASLQPAARLAARWQDGVAVVGSGSQPSQAISFPRAVRTLTWIDYLVIIGYFGLLAGIGFYFSKQESSEEFSLGNRNVSWWAAGISMFATGASAISFMAIPALAFATNLVWTLPLIAFLPAFFINAYLIFPLLRRMEITSTYEYLERRFNKPLRLIASAQCIVIQTFGRTAVVLVLPAIAISAVTGMNVFFSVILMGVLTTIYTSVGGFESVIWTEVFQGILKLVAPIVMIIVAIYSLPGGLGEFWNTSITMDKTACALLTWDITVPALWILAVSTLLTATIGTAGDQPIIQRVFSTPMNQVRRLTMMSTFCSIVIGLVVNLLGLAIFAYFRAHPGEIAATSTNDQIVPIFVTQAMPAGFAGMVIAAIFASAMATVASAMNSVATIYAADFYPLIRPNATDKDRLRTLKMASYLCGFVGTIMALLLAATNPVSLMIVWSKIVSLVGGGVVGVYSLGMFTKRVNGFGAVCGAIASIVITLLVSLFTPLHWATYMPIAILSCMLCGYLFSLFAPQTKDLTGLTVYTPASKAAAGEPAQA